MFSFWTSLVQYNQCDQVVTIPNLSFKTKKYLLCIFLIVRILVFMWRQWIYSRFVMSINPSPFGSLILISSQFLILVSKHMYTWQKPQGWWSVVWDGKNWLFCNMLICSFVHFYFYVNIYSLQSSLHWCLKYQKKILADFFKTFFLWRIKKNGPLKKFDKVVELVGGEPVINRLPTVSSLI